MKIKKYRPGFVTGFEDEFYEVNTREELMNCELIKDAEEYGVVYLDRQCIMVLVSVKEQRWYVIAIVNSIEDQNILKSWLPDWNEAVHKLNEK